MLDPHTSENAPNPQLPPARAEAFSASPRGPASRGPSDGRPTEMWLDDLRRAVQAPVSWLWQDYLAAGSSTLLTSQWKSGKTTLVSVLLARLQQGGELAGRALAAGKAVILSEESLQQWDLRSRKLDFGNHLCWFCRPFRGKPRLDQWLALVDRLVELRAEHGIALVVVDPLARLLAGAG